MTGGNKGKAANPNDPVFFTTITPKGKKAEKGCAYDWCKARRQDKAMAGGKGNAESMNLKGAVRQWSGVEGAGKAATDESRHPLHHTIEVYKKEKERKSIFGERD